MPEASLLRFSPEVAGLLDSSGLDIVITGAGGWVGQAMVEMLEIALGPGFRDQVHVFGTSRRAMWLRSGTPIECHALSELSDLRIGPHVVAHLAFVTREHVVARRLDDYVAENELISRIVLDHADQSDVVGLFLPFEAAPSTVTAGVWTRNFVLTPTVPSSSGMRPASPMSVCQATGWRLFGSSIWRDRF